MGHAATGVLSHLMGVAYGSVGRASLDYAPTAGAANLPGLLAARHWYACGVGLYGKVVCVIKHELFPVPSTSRQSAVCCSKA